MSNSVKLPNFLSTGLNALIKRSAGSQSNIPSHRHGSMRETLGLHHSACMLIFD
jgi:hypothetical protein